METFGSVRPLGLDRYQRTLFNQFRSEPLNFYPSVIGAHDGSVWVNSHGESLMRWTEGRITTFGSFVTYGPLANRSNGDVCFIDSRASELQCYGSHIATYITLDPRISFAPSLALVEDSDKSLLASFQGKGIWRYNGHWEPLTAPGLPNGDPLAMFLDSKSRLWLGFLGDRISVRSGSRFQFLSIAPGRWANTLAFCEGGNTVWAAGSSGLSVFDGNRMRVLRYGNDVFHGISGIVFDRMGNLWLNAEAGALRVTSDQIYNVLKSPDRKLGAEVFGDRYGLTGEPTQFKPTPSLVRDTKGRLWFATAGDLVWVNPERIAEDRTPMAIKIESVSINGRQLPVTHFEALAVHERSSDLHSLEVDYAAVDLSDPERIIYRYRLLGEDTAWQDAGSRREAFYNRLSPGKYSFEVSARRGHGQWSDLRAPLVLEVTPAYYQTGWFFLSLVLGGVSLAILGYVLRLRQITARIRLVAEERANERLRIAGNLHDTLLQSFQGLMLRFQSVDAMMLYNPAGAREELEGALDRADQALAESRDAIQGIRSLSGADFELAHEVKVLVDQLSDSQQSRRRKPVTTSVVVEGEPRSLYPWVGEELCRIASEALRNSFAHSQATHIEVEIAYSKLFLRVRLRDDGIGISPAVLKHGGREGHWGLQGMKERADRIRAKISVWSKEGGGTEVEIIVPASAVFDRKSSRRLRDKLQGKA